MAPSMVCALLSFAIHTTLATSAAVRNSNHIFNAVHSSMRQFGSSLNHNGMSSFIATVPEGTQFFHGTSSHDRINGTEWLAFEPEHALGFARQPGGRGPGRDPGRGIGKPPIPAQQVSITVDAESGESHGWLHTYRTRHDLRLLYVDGQSAAKSTKGTLDLQDMVLLQGNLTLEDDGSGTHMGPMNEYQRAKGLCRIAKTEWKNRIDGILRMEGGFEIILCSFEEHLDVERILQVEDSSERGPGGGIDSFSRSQAIAARYDGIGGGRVKLNYDNFVTLFSMNDTIFFDDSGLPRVRNSTATIDAARMAVTDMILRDESPAIDWQSIADMVVARYEDRIVNLASGNHESLSDLREELEVTMRPYIDYGERNATVESQRCAFTYIPTGANISSVAARAVIDVAHRICTTLSDASLAGNHTTALSTVRQLKNWLKWTTWKRCRGCRADEVCFLPIWPQGSREDFEQPQCRSANSPRRSGYWGGFGGRP